jgi:tungstate transport system permease protein
MVLIVSGDIGGVTRTMTTVVVLETSRGNLRFALALGMVLMGISLGVSGVVFAGGEEKGSAEMTGIVPCSWQSAG